MQPLQKSRLGRGLASLIGDPNTQPVAPRLPPEGEQRVLPIDLIRAGRFNPRKDFREEELAELTESIRQKGLVQPIVVRPDPASGGYEIVAGERRWRAAQRVPLHQVSVIISSSATRTRSRLRSSRTSSAPISMRSRRRAGIGS